MAKRPFPSYWMFRDKDGNWRWNFAAGNGKVVAASSVAYLRREGCIRSIQIMKGSAQIPVWGPQADVKGEGAAAQIPAREAASAE
jgi:uncharacterized protein YegP (UPF0339 family)